MLEVFSAKGGDARLLRRDELPTNWDPATDKRLTDWECAQHLARSAGIAGRRETLNAAAARCWRRWIPPVARRPASLAYRLYDNHREYPFPA